MYALNVVCCSLLLWSTMLPTRLLACNNKCMKCFHGSTKLKYRPHIHIRYKHTSADTCTPMRIRVKNSCRPARVACVIHVRRYVLTTESFGRGCMSFSPRLTLLGSWICPPCSPVDVCPSTRPVSPF